MAEQDEYDLDDTLYFAMNKLNAANAFDVNADFIKSIPNLLKEGHKEESWAKTSEGIAAGSKIYGFRVDNINKKVHNVLNGFHRTNTNFQDKQEVEEGTVGQGKAKKNKRKTIGNKDFEQWEDIGLSTLDTEAHITSDFSSMSSNIDIAFHQLTEQQDIGNFK